MKDFVQFVLTDDSRTARFSGAAFPPLVDAVTPPLWGEASSFFYLWTFKSSCVFLEFLKA